MEDKYATVGRVGDGQKEVSRRWRGRQEEAAAKEVGGGRVREGVGGREKPREEGGRTAGGGGEGGEQEEGGRSVGGGGEGRRRRRRQRRQ